MSFIIGDKLSLQLGNGIGLLVLDVSSLRQVIVEPQAVANFTAVPKTSVERIALKLHQRHRPEVATAFGVLQSLPALTPPPGLLAGIGMSSQLREPSTPGQLASAAVSLQLREPVTLDPLVCVAVLQPHCELAATHAVFPPCLLCLRCQCERDSAQGTSTLHRAPSRRSKYYAMPMKGQGPTL